MNALKRMKIGKKLGVIVLALMVPIVLLAVLYARTGWQDISFVNKEAGGIPYLVEARNLMQAMADHRAFTTQVKEGDTAATSRIPEAAARAAKGFETLRAITTEDDDRYQARSVIDALEAEWTSVASGWQATTMDANVAAHGNVINKAYGLFPFIGNHSGLKLDSDLKTFYLMDIVVLRAPRIVTGLLDARGVSVIAASQETVAPELRDQVVVALDKAQLEIGRMDESVKGVAEHNPQAAEEIRSAVQALGAATGEFSAIAMRSLGNEVVAVNDVREKAGAAVHQGYELFDHAAPLLASAFEETERALRIKVGASLAAALIAVAFALFMSVFIQRLIVRSLTRAVDVFKAIGEGGADAEISKGNDGDQNRCRSAPRSRPRLEETASSMEEMTSTVKQNADNARARPTSSRRAWRRARRPRRAARWWQGGAGDGRDQRLEPQDRRHHRRDRRDRVPDQPAGAERGGRGGARRRAGPRLRGGGERGAQPRAAQLATAAKEIKALIQDSVGKVEEGSKLVDESGRRSRRSCRR
jgi:hypothetical protein